MLNVQTILQHHLAPPKKKKKTILQHMLQDIDAANFYWFSSSSQ